MSIISLNLVLVWIVRKLHLRLFFLFIYFLRSAFLWFLCFSSGSHALFTKPINLFFQQNFIKNGSHGTIHTLKNYSAIVLLIFNFQRNKQYLNTHLT